MVKVGVKVRGKNPGRKHYSIVFSVTNICCKRSLELGGYSISRREIGLDPAANDISFSFFPRPPASANPFFIFTPRVIDDGEDETTAPSE